MTFQAVEIKVTGVAVCAGLIETEQNTPDMWFDHTARYIMSGLSPFPLAELPA